MRECDSIEEQIKIVYGFEQVLPPASAYLWKQITQQVVPAVVRPSGPHKI